MAYYQIYWDAIRALPAREQLRVLADIAATVPVEMARERVRVVGRTVERHAAERPWGAQSRAAAELGLTKGRVGQLWSEYKEHRMTTTSYGSFSRNVADPGRVQPRRLRRHRARRRSRRLRHRIDRRGTEAISKHRRRGITLAGASSTTTPAPKRRRDHRRRHQNVDF